MSSSPGPRGSLHFQGDHLPFSWNVLLTPVPTSKTNVTNNTIMAHPGMTRTDFCRPEQVSAVRVITWPSVKCCSSAEAWVKPVLARRSTQISEQDTLTAHSSSGVTQRNCHPTFPYSCFSSGALLQRGELGDAVTSTTPNRCIHAAKGSFKGN